MNARAAEILYAAERMGVRQIKGQFSDGRGGLCALGALGYAESLTGRDLDQRYEFRESFGFGSFVAFECCGKTLTESGLIVHLNDDHDATFAEIARKLGPDHV